MNGVYLLVQFVLGPWYGYWLGKKCGLGCKGAPLCALAGFLVIAVPV